MTEPESQLLFALAHAGDGDQRGHQILGHDQLIACTQMPTAQLRDTLELLSLGGLVHMDRVQGRLPFARLTYAGREAAHRRGAGIPSPVDDARALQRFLAAQGTGEQRGQQGFSGSQVVKQLGWGVDRADDAARVLHDEGAALRRGLMGRDRFHIMLTAQGRAIA